MKVTKLNEETWKLEKSKSEKWLEGYNWSQINGSYPDHIEFFDNNEGIGCEVKLYFGETAKKVKEYNENYK